MDGTTRDGFTVDGIAADGIAADGIAADGIAADRRAADGIAAATISMDGFTIRGITVERILPHGTPGRDDDPVEIPVQASRARPVPHHVPRPRPAQRAHRTHLGRLGRPGPTGRTSQTGHTDRAFADLEPAGLGRLGLDIRRLELRAFDEDVVEPAVPGLGDHRPAGEAGRPADRHAVLASPGEAAPADQRTTAGDRIGPAAAGALPGEDLPGGDLPGGDLPPAFEVFDRAARDYDADIHGVPFFRPLGRTLASAAGIRPGDDVIDLACGRGAVLFPAAEATGATGSVRAFDLAPTMVELTAADVTARALPWVEVEVADAAEPPAEPGSADVVLCGMGLFLLPDPTAALARWRGLLRPGGRLAVSVFGAPDPLWDRPDYPLRRATGTGAAQRRPGLAILAEGALGEALTAAGFTITGDDLVATDLVFRDVEHWWRWARGTAVRSMLEKVDDADIPAMIDDLTRWHAPSVDAGGLHWRPTVRIVTATVGIAAAGTMMVGGPDCR
ncbi:class I SAM-dependent methyltransferase [Parafrankia elaeagni]|uniref:class I SAM-dependent methyltransferase n=1 Tax=Parafrankia elaeagni TaxID=222534 RepID=UPI00037A7E7C|nr:class I SAM-dependent methyltransferase [Parafrankia elaeagni]